MKCRNFSMHKSFFSKSRKTLHIVSEHSKSLSDGKLHCFGKQYWNQNKYFILISIDFNTRVCSPLVCFDILPNWRLSRYFDLEFCFKSFFLFASNPKEEEEKKKKLLNPTREENFDFETKVRDKMPTERETYYLSYLAAFIDWSRRIFSRYFPADKRAKFIQLFKRALNWTAWKKNLEAFARGKIAFL